MNKWILSLILLIVSTSFAAEIEVNGEVNADYATYWDKNFDPFNAANQKIGLSLTAHLNEAVSVILASKLLSTYMSEDGELEESEVRHGKSRSTAMGDEDHRFNSFKFDGITFRWALNSNVAVLFGDLIYSAGSFNYYFWRDEARYNVISQEQRLRGIGVELEEGRVYIGASENNPHSMLVFGSYPIELISKTEERLLLTPSAEWAFGSEIGRSYTYAIGLETVYAKSSGDMNYGVTATWGTHPYKGKGVHSFLLEPSFNFKFFNLGLSYFQALVAKKDAPVDEQIFTEDQTMLFIEPSFELHKKVALGFAYEYHDPNNEIHEDQRHLVGPNLYLYPTTNVDLVFWAGYNILKRKANHFSMGISAQANF